MARRCICPSTPRSRAAAACKEVIQCRNGDLVRLAPAAPASSTRCRPGGIYKDGALLVEADARTVADRRRLSFAGAVSVALAITDKGELAADPELDLIGIPERDRDGALDARGGLRRRRWRPSNRCRAARRRDPDAVAEAVRRAVRAAVARALGQEADVPRARA